MNFAQGMRSVGLLETVGMVCVDSRGGTLKIEEVRLSRRKVTAAVSHVGRDPVGIG